MKEAIYVTDGGERRGPFELVGLFVHFDEAAAFMDTVKDATTGNFFTFLYGAAFNARHQAWKQSSGNDQPSGFVDLLFILQSFQQAFDDWKYRGRHTASGLPQEIEIESLPADLKVILKSVTIDSVREIFGIYCLRLQSGATVAPRFCDVGFSLRMMLRCMGDENIFQACIENRPEDIF